MTVVFRPFWYGYGTRRPLGWPYHASVQVHALEQWLDEGWSPWRIGYGLANLIAMTVTVFVYVRQPHHPGAIWWLMAAVAIVALWALGEMLRWRIKYRRLLIAQQASSSELQPQPIRKLLTDGKELHADIANHASWWGADRLLTNGVPGRIVRWEGNASEALINQPEVLILFQNAPSLDANRPISGQACGRLEHELNVLESAINGGAGDFKPSSDQSVVARVKTDLEAYYAERVKSLQEVREEGCALLTTIIADNDRDAEADSGLRT